MYVNQEGGLAQWAGRLTRNVSVVGSSHMKSLRCFIEQKSSPIMLRTGWFKKRIPW